MTTTSKKITFIDLFAGIGGFHYGLQQAGEFNCVFANEWDRYANAVYTKHFGECDNRDIRLIRAYDIPDHDLLVGGFPCQSFSTSGKRGGFDDTRGTLFFEIARILKKKRSRLLLLENVKGLLSHDDGRTFKTIITTLDELGYDVQWQVLNSKNFGVPQNRERVYIVGHLRGTPRPEIFPFTKDDYKTSYTGVADSKGEKRFIATRQLRRNGSLTSRLCPTIQAIECPHIIDGDRVRRLTPIECERLQAFPDNWTELDIIGRPISDEQRYKMLGNAVTTAVVKAIGIKLLTSYYNHTTMKL